MHARRELCIYSTLSQQTESTKNSHNGMQHTHPFGDYSQAVVVWFLDRADKENESTQVGQFLQTTKSNGVKSHATVGILFGRQSDTPSPMRLSCMFPDLSRSLLSNFHAENRSMSQVKVRTSLILSTTYPPAFASIWNLKPTKQQMSKSCGCTLRHPYESHNDHLQWKGGLGNTGTCLGNI